MFKKGDYSNPYFHKAHLEKTIGNFTRPGMVHAFIRADDYDLKKVRAAGNSLERKHK